VETQSLLFFIVSHQKRKLKNGRQHVDSRFSSPAAALAASADVFLGVFVL
jgi:hypothetical protein